MATFVIADDSPIPRQILRRIVTQDLGFEVIGEAKNGLEAVELCRKLKPDAVIFDISMPMLSGGEAAKIVVAEQLAQKVFIASSMAMDAIFQPLQAIGCITVAKPYKSELLSRVILAHLGGLNGAVASAGNPPDRDNGAA